jgi:hypothetical protein
VTGAQTFSTRTLNNNTAGPTSQKNVFYPFKFFFCKDWSVSLPLVALQFHDVELRITWSANLGQTINFGATNLPALSPLPQATANLLSTGTVVVGANTANVVFQQSTGPLFPGSLVVGALSNLQTNVAIIQTVSNISTGPGGSANVVVAFANSAASNIIVASGGFGAAASGGIANIYAPVVAAQVPVASTISGTSAQLTFNTFSSPVSGSGVQLGQYVAGLPVTGPVYVSSVSNVAQGNVTVTFPSQTATTVIAGTTVGFFNGAVTSALTYAGLQFQCWTNFVYLDQSERDYFAKTTQDLLITQVTRVSVLTNPVQEIALAQPIKFIAFPSVNFASLWANGSNSTAAFNYQLKTQINGVDVGESRFLTQFVDLAQYYNTPFGYNHNQATANVAIISYCLDTSKLQPTGTLNFSRIDTFRIVVPPQLTNGVLGLCNSAINYPSVYLYAVNYNVLRIQNGLGGVLYAN